MERPFILVSLKYPLPLAIASIQSIRPDVYFLVWATHDYQVYIQQSPANPAKQDGFFHIVPFTVVSGFG